MLSKEMKYFRQEQIVKNFYRHNHVFSVSNMTDCLQFGTHPITLHKDAMRDRWHCIVVGQSPMKLRSSSLTTEKEVLVILVCSLFMIK